MITSDLTISRFLKLAIGFSLLSILIITSSKVFAENSIQMEEPKISSEKGTNRLTENEKAKVQALLEGRLAGLSSNIEGAATLVDSFFNDVEISSLLGGLDGNDETPIVFDYNFRIPGSGFGKNTKLQIKLNTNAKVSQDLSTELGVDAAALLQNQISDMDDVEISFSYDVNSENIGSDLRINQELFDDVASPILYDSAIQSINQEIQKNDIALLQLPQIDQILRLENTPLTEYDCGLLAASLARAYIQVGRGSVDSKRDSENARSLCELNKILVRDKASLGVYLTSQYHPYVFANLLANQPKLQFSGAYRNRSDLVGPDEFSVKVSYSFGSININSLRRKGFEEAYLKHVSCILSAKDKRGSGARRCISDGKFSLSLEYFDIEDQRYRSGQTDFLRVGGERIEGAVGYSRTLSWDKSEPLLNLNLSLKFEEYLGDTAGNDRVLATATLTRKINDRLSIPVSIQYANKGEFLEDVDDQLSGNVGLKYDFNFN